MAGWIPIRIGVRVGLWLEARWPSGAKDGVVSLHGARPTLRQAQESQAQGRLPPQVPRWRSGRHRRVAGCCLHGSSRGWVPAPYRVRGSLCAGTTPTGCSPSITRTNHGGGGWVGQAGAPKSLRPLEWRYCPAMYVNGFLAEVKSSRRSPNTSVRPRVLAAGCSSARR